KLSRACNGSRDACLRTCDLARVRSKCGKTCERKFRKSGAKRRLCKEECEQRSCYDECRDGTCCVGPEQCRAGEKAYRCAKVKLDC
ncbi:hypothetical protein BDW02DRAFT_463223, partial [Decorospora gaudefroyi]